MYMEANRRVYAGPSNGCEMENPEYMATSSCCIYAKEFVMRIATYSAEYLYSSVQETARDSTPAVRSRK